jgi:hypothetical protein
VTDPVEIEAAHRSDRSELFRALNERIHELGVSAKGRFNLVCECGDDRCAQVLRMTPHEYESLRSHPAWFALLPGHEQPLRENVVSRRTAYVIVEKLPGSRSSLEANHPTERSTDVTDSSGAQNGPDSRRVDASRGPGTGERADAAHARADVR